MPVAFGISLSGYKKTPTTQQYQSKYKEYELVGEWVYKDTRTLRKYHYDIDYTILLTEDTLEFGYNNEVISRTKETFNHTLIQPEKNGVHTNL